MAAIAGEIENFQLPSGAAGRRRLAGFLAKAGEEGIYVNGVTLSKQEALAHMMWELLLQGEISFPGSGRLLMVDDFQDWAGLAKFVFTHLDGPAVTMGDSRATNTVVRVVFGDADPYPEGQPVAG